MSTQIAQAEEIDGDIVGRRRVVLLTWKEGWRQPVWHSLLTAAVALRAESAGMLTSVPAADDLITSEPLGTKSEVLCFLAISVSECVRDRRRKPLQCTHCNKAYYIKVCLHNAAKPMQTNSVKRRAFVLSFLPSVFTCLHVQSGIWCLTHVFIRVYAWMHVSLCGFLRVSIGVPVRQLFRNLSGVKLSKQDIQLHFSGWSISFGWS